jgi:hypothetical protein
MPTNVWVVTWRGNGDAVFRIVHMTIDAYATDLTERVPTIIRRSLAETP